jgi:molecular chaperone GrpE
MTSNTDQTGHQPKAKADACQDGETSAMDTPSDKLGLQVEALQAELDEMQNRWMRSEAEIVNVRARAKRDVDEARQFAVQKFANDMIDAAENLRRGLNNLPAATPDEPKSISGLRSGLMEVERSFLGLLERNGVKSENPIGSMFSPDFHQAIAERETTDHSAGTVLQTLTPSWNLNGRLLRPAIVIVAKSASQASAEKIYSDAATPTD